MATDPKKMTKMQKKLIVEFVKQNPDLNSGKFTNDFTHEKCKELWEDIAKKLNSLVGPTKTWSQWRKAWQDYKRNVKNKCTTENKHAKNTGGGESLTLQYSDTENEVRELIGKTSIKGLERPKESSTSFDFTEPLENITNDANAENQSASAVGTVEVLQIIPLSPQSSEVIDFPNSEPQASTSRKELDGAHAVPSGSMVKAPKPFTKRGSRKLRVKKPRFAEQRLRRTEEVVKDMTDANVQRQNKEEVYKNEKLLHLGKLNNYLGEIIQETQRKNDYLGEIVEETQRKNDFLGEIVQEKKRKIDYLGEIVQEKKRKNNLEEKKIEAVQKLTDCLDSFFKSYSQKM